MLRPTNAPEIKPSTISDIEIVCGGEPPAPFIAYTVFLNGEPVCVAGILLYECPEVFSDFAPMHGIKLDVPKTMIYRYAKILLKRLRSHGLPAVTTALTGRSKFLESLGLEFAHKKDNRYFYRI